MEELLCDQIASTALIHTSAANQISASPLCGR